MRDRDLIGGVGDRTVIFRGLAYDVPILRVEDNERTGARRVVGLSPQALWEGDEITTPSGSKILVEKPGTYTIDCTYGSPETVGEALLAVLEGRSAEWKLIGFTTTPYDWSAIESK